ncbi:tRNA (adenosine(37)-N6)-dimethylallyltransferase MiaA [Pseudohalioglobus lutimaris]|uniref:tRNA dimethylallyltransferase n=1 Tax=Pseudohalioglobus lutimaris TaxID=1737061 RepID=A0A2N5X1N6_9GAMM|nr:tRNA (adenosine(37)-N6)-dimethylallyltransferase MiaA [Pseudohalioglobus lutimaris]PLW68392.1 tRNA (adenosine(37)-N6)-dimethylallyltransferase MiaA [Pseudohalioglobus lutimaris]
MSNNRSQLICLMGPTASGKTDLAIELAEHLDGELVSVDSALVYRGLDIGSAKPDYPHHLVDIRDPGEPYSAAEFVADATRVATDISARGKTPILVGGTMLYFKAFLQGLAAMPAADPDIRQAIEAQASQFGWPHMHQLLAEVDPVSAARIHPNHSQRLARALEVYRSSGRSLSAWHSEQSALYDPFERWDIHQLAICPLDRAVLHQRIALRFQLMMAAGFLDEVRALHSRGDLSADLPAIRAVGYRQLWQHLEGFLTLEEAEEKAVAATRQLAKRQLTWLRKWHDLAWIYTDSEGKFEKLVTPSGAAPGLAQGDVAHAAQPEQSSIDEPAAYRQGETHSLAEAALKYLRMAPM